MLNHLQPTLKLLRNQVFRCAAACPLGAQTVNSFSSQHGSCGDGSDLVAARRQENQPFVHFAAKIRATRIKSRDEAVIQNAILRGRISQF